MSPVTHLLGSWLVAAQLTDNPRDCRLATLAGVLADADGLGMVADMASGAFGHQTAFFAQYHHFLLHGLFGGVVIAALLAAFARRRGRVLVLALLLFHLHLLCDLSGSRGPMAEDLWPIFYFGPFNKDPMWIWKGQWPIDGWPNRLLSLALLLGVLVLAVRRGDSVLGVFNRRIDQVFVGVLRQWHGALTQRRPGPAGPESLE